MPRPRAPRSREVPPAYNPPPREWQRMRLRDLMPASYNPRAITAEERAGLEASLRRFGLVENIVWNRRTGNIVGGHQRVEQLLMLGCEEEMVCVVDLPLVEEKALNLALNNPKIAGHFTPDVQVVVADVRAEMPEVVADLRFDAMLADLDLGPPSLDEDETGGGGGDEQEGSWVKLAEIFGTDKVPPAVAEVVREAVEAAMSGSGFEARWQALEVLAAEFLAGTREARAARRGSGRGRG